MQGPVPSRDDATPGELARPVSGESGLPGPKDDVRFSAEHRLRRASQRETPPGRPVYRRRIVRDVLIAIVLGLLALALVPFADVANPDYPEARDIADRINAVWEAIIHSGAVPEEAAAAAHLRVLTYEDEQPRTVLTHPEPTSKGICYALRFGPGILTMAGTLLKPAAGCTPQPPGRFDRSGAWSDVLPSERLTMWWFLPLMILIGGGVLYAGTDIVIKLTTKPSTPARWP
jgi:hypothetical protein